MRFYFNYFAYACTGINPNLHGICIYSGITLHDDVEVVIDVLAYILIVLTYIYLLYALA